MVGGCPHKNKWKIPEAGLIEWMASADESNKAAGNREQPNSVLNNEGEIKRKNFNDARNR
jgi:hypothetical protein